jgi:hypothetical protein
MEGVAQRMEKLSLCQAGARATPRPGPDPAGAGTAS